MPMHLDILRIHGAKVVDGAWNYKNSHVQMKNLKKVLTIFQSWYTSKDHYAGMAELADA